MSMKNLYEQVYNRQNDVKRIDIHQAYSDVYNESEEVDNKDKPNVVVFYSYNSDAYTELAKLAEANPDTIKSASMDVDYFQKRVEGRLEEAMYTTTQAVIKQIFKIKMDQVALRGIYEVLASNRINNSTMTAIQQFKSGESAAKDNLIDTIKGVQEYQIVNVIDELALTYSSLINPGDVQDDSTVKPVPLINELWDVKEVEGRTSVGRGELAMCMFSKAIKGTPGDVVTDDDFKQDDETEQATDTRVAAEGGVRLEVKGFGGRPGLGKYVDGFSSRARVHLKDVEAGAADAESIHELVAQNYQGGIDINSVTLLDMVTTFFKEYHDGLVLEIPQSELLQSHTSTWSDFYENVLRQYVDPQTTPDVFNSLNYGVKMSAFVEQVINLQRQLQQEHPKATSLLPRDGAWRHNKNTNNFFRMNSMIPVISDNMINLRNIFNILGDTSQGATKGSKAMSLPRVVEYQRRLILAPKDAIDNKTSFSEAVKTLFQVVLPGQDVDVEVLANILAEARPEPLDPQQHENLVSAVRDMLINRPDAVFQTGESAGNNTVERVIGAVQLASYCTADEFTHAMLVDDRPGTTSKQSLVIRTDPSNIAATWTRIFNAFVTHNVTVPLSIDAQNKGVQLKYTGSQ